MLFAASDTAHQHHAESLKLVESAANDRAYCSAHSLAELYATLTATPVPRLRKTSDVSAGVQNVVKIFTPVELDLEDYLWVVQHAGKSGIRSGQIYDALILKCAEKVRASTIYTWNLRHFRNIAWAGIAEKVRTP